MSLPSRFLRFAGFIPVMLAFLLAINPAFVEVSGQNIVITPNPPPVSNQIDCYVNSLQPLNGVLKHPPFYNIFWVFGDGEFAPVPGVGAYWQQYNPAIYQLQSPIEPYVYPNRLAEYSNQAFLISRKSDDKPPPPPAAQYWIHPGNATQASKIALTDTGFIHILHNQGYLRPPAQNTGDKEKSVFVISYQGRVVSDSDALRVLFFYNSHYKADGTLFAPAANLSPDNATPQYLLPNYDKASLSEVYGDSRITKKPTYLTAGAFDAAMNSQTTFADGFSNAIEMNLKGTYINELNLLHSNQNRNHELRVFYPFFTESTQIGANQQFASLAILTSNVPPAGNPSGPVELLTKWGAYKDAVNNKWKIGSDYVHGLDTALLALGEPSDPNELVIEKICKCGDQNKYTVKFNLSFCNEEDATTPARTAIIKLDEIADGLDIRKVTMKGSLATTCTFNRTNPQQINIKKFVLEPGDCMDITIYATLKENKVTQLIQGPVLKGSVKFGENGIEDPFENVPLPAAPDPTGASLLNYNDSLDPRWVNKDSVPCNEWRCECNFEDTCNCKVSWTAVCMPRPAKTVLAIGVFMAMAFAGYGLFRRLRKK